MTEQSRWQGHWGGSGNSGTEQHACRARPQQLLLGPATTPPRSLTRVSTTVKAAYAANVQSTTAETRGWKARARITHTAAAVGMRSGCADVEHRVIFGLACGGRLHWRMLGVRHEGGPQTEWRASLPAGWAARSDMLPAGWAARSVTLPARHPSRAPASSQAVGTKVKTMARKMVAMLRAPRSSMRERAPARTGTRQSAAQPMLGTVVGVAMLRTARSSMRERAPAGANRAKGEGRPADAASWHCCAMAQLKTKHNWLQCRRTRSQVPAKTTHPSCCSGGTAGPGPATGC